MPYLELKDCKLFYTIDDHTDPWARPDASPAGPSSLSMMTTDAPRAATRLRRAFGQSMALPSSETPELF